MAEGCIVGADLGGTNVRAQAFDASGKALGQRIENESEATLGTDRVVSAIVKTVLEAAASAGQPLLKVGIAVPGHIDNAAGLVKWAPNFGEEIDGVFHYWQDVQLKAPLEEQLGCPVHMGNDANLAAIGEYRFGTGENRAKCLVMLTLGTGVGGGVVMSPQSVVGSTNSPLLLVGGNLGGIELGHTLIQKGGLDCNSGAYGSLEAYCQRDALIRRAVHRLRRGESSLLNDLCHEDWSKIDPQMLHLAAEKGDVLSIQVWDEFGSYLGSGIGSMINVFSPDVFVLGGKISQAGEFFLDRAIREAKAFAIPSLYKDTKIVLAKHIDDAGILGGVALAMELV